MTGEGITCSSSPDKVQTVAENLSRDWRFAKQLVESYGGRFVAFLQPVAYLGHAPTDGLNLTERRRKEFNPTYAAFKEWLRKMARFIVS